MNSSDNSVKIIIVDDEPETIRSLELPLRAAGYQHIESYTSGTQLLTSIQPGDAAVVLLDLFMPKLEGDKVLVQLKSAMPGVDVIIVTGDNRIDKAVEMMRLGASDYLVKPVEENRLLASVNRSIELLELKNTNLQLKDRLLSRQIKHPENFKKIVTRNDTMRDIFRYIEVIARTNQPVLITGETGVGKELLAESIHQTSGRPGKYVKINVGGLDDNMFSDTLFGHFKGAFTGASSHRKGMLEQAENGTILLDEMGSLAPQSQVKLLRLLQDNEYYPLGADAPKHASTRILATTNCSIHQLMRREDFRPDLYYRLRTHHIHIPALRERPGDLPLLLRQFIREAAEELSKEPPTPHPALIQLLNSYAFPGNIRELRALVFEAVSKHTSHMLSTKVFADYIPGAEAYEGATCDRKETASRLKNLEILPTLKEMDNMLVEEALSRSEGNQSLAARMLGISPSAMNKRISVLNKK